MTFQDITDYVFMYLEDEMKQPPTPGQLRLLGNLALDSIQIRDSSWSNSDDMTGLLSMTLPPDCNNVTRVVFNGDELQKTNLYTMDVQYPGWRDSVGIPTAYIQDGTDILLNAKPPAAAIGTLQIFGSASIGHFPLTDLDPNPLDYLPIAHQMAPAYYILSELPAYTEVGQIRVQRFAAKWQYAFDRIHYAAATRRSEAYGNDSLE